MIAPQADVASKMLLRVDVRSMGPPRSTWGMRTLPKIAHFSILG